MFLRGVRAASIKRDKKAAEPDAVDAPQRSAAPHTCRNLLRRASAPSVSRSTNAKRPPRGGSKEAEAGAWLLQEICQGAESLLGEDVMLDDRAKLTVGKKLREAKKTGYPFVILFGKKCLDQDPMLELYIMQTGEVVELRPNELLEILSNKFKNNG